MRYIIIKLFAAWLALAGYAFASQAAEHGIAGGLIIHLGCGTGTDTATLRLKDSFIVHGLDTSPTAIKTAREYLSKKECYGPISADTFDGRNLPYADNTVNILKITNKFNVSDNEIMRVLAPRGIVISGEEISVAPVPEDIDEWTHFLYNASGNAVSSDRKVAPLNHLKWEGGPRWSRSHETDMSMTAMVSAHGRIFYIIDEGPVGIHETPTGQRIFPDKCALVARDAFNGIILWKRPVPNWGSTAWDANRWRWGPRDMVFSSPLNLPRRLVTTGDRIYITLGFKAFVSELDAFSGKTLREFRYTANTEEILLHNSRLYLHTQSEPGSHSIMTVDLESGRQLWQKAVSAVTTLSLAVGKQHVFFHNNKKVVALNSSSGQIVWQTKTQETTKNLNGGGTLITHKNVVLFAGQKTTEVFSTKDGKRLWQCPAHPSFRGMPDVFFAGGYVWIGTLCFNGRDINTGEIAKTIDAENLFTSGHHVRCHRARATENYLLWSKRGIEFMDIKSNGHARHDWVRSSCRYGLMPANGMVYTAPTPCFCFPGVKKNGFNALSAKDGAVTPSKRRKQQISRGPAFENISNTFKTSTEDWATYRHDAARSGCTETVVPSGLKEKWSVLLGGRATPPVSARGRIYIAQKDAHTLHCLDSETGKKLWHFIAGGRIDSPPTIHGERVLFGSNDGRVYCLSASTGKQAWIFQATPYDKRIVSYGNLHSAWPVHGSVLVENDTVYFAAGISSFLDGGISIYGLDPASGTVRYMTRLKGPEADLSEPSKRAHDMEGAKNDILVCSNNRIYMLHNVFDLKLQKLETKRIARYGALETDLHLSASGGFLDDTGFDRLYWIYARRWPGLYYADKAPKAGQILVFDKNKTYGIHKFNQKYSRSPYFTPGISGIELFADDNSNEPELTTVQERRERGTMTRKKKPVWSVQIPVNGRSMVLAGKVLFVAGPPDTVDSKDPLGAIEERCGGKLWAVSSENGKKLSEYDLKSAPVFDGLIAAQKKLYIVMQDGTISCWK